MWDGQHNIPLEMSKSYDPKRPEAEFMAVNQTEIDECWVHFWINLITFQIQKQVNNSKETKPDEDIGSAICHLKMKHV